VAEEVKEVEEVPGRKEGGGEEGCAQVAESEKQGSNDYDEGDGQGRVGSGKVTARGL
jgi:hypothetical protein